MKRWLLAFAILALSVGIQWAALYIEQTFKVPATMLAFWSIYALFPVCGYIVGRIKPLWLAFIALLTILGGEVVAGANLLQVLSVLNPRVNEMDFPDMVFGFYILPAIALSVPVFIIGAILAHFKRPKPVPASTVF